VREPSPYFIQRRPAAERPVSLFNQSHETTLCTLSHEACARVSAAGRPNTKLRAVTTPSSDWMVERGEFELSGDFINGQ
jgi:hypothetical protein